MAGERWYHRLRRSSNSNHLLQPKSPNKSPSKLISSIINHRYSFSSSSSPSSSSSSSSSSSLSKSINSNSNSNNNTVGVLAFEVAGMASKLIHLHASLSDKNIVRLKNEYISLDGVRKIVSNDDDFLLGLACAEILHSLRLLATSLSSNLSHRCRDPNLRCFLEVFDDFAERGRDPYNWVLAPKEYDSLKKKLDRQITAVSDLYCEMEELSRLDDSLHRKSNIINNQQHHHPETQQSDRRVVVVVLQELQNRIAWQKQKVKSARDRSLWTRNFDSVTLALVRLVFTVLARINLVFGIGHNNNKYNITTLPRSLSANSAVVFPSCHDTATTATAAAADITAPVRLSVAYDDVEKMKKMDRFFSTSTAAAATTGFFESNTKVLNPPPGTLGASALSLHYANLIIVLEKMVKSPQLIGLDARDDLYSMLPNTIRSALRSRLRGVGFSATDPVLAGEWRNALARILGWLAPLAHNMIKWQSERSFDQRNHHNQLIAKRSAPTTTTTTTTTTRGATTTVFLLQTLFFANKDKTEAAITELLVGLNYIWRFEREMNAIALFDSFNNVYCSTTTTLQLRTTSSYDSYS